LISIIPLLIWALPQDEIAYSIFAVFMCIFIAVSVSAFITNILSALLFRVIYRVKNVDETEDYEPIAKLLHLGWKKNKPDPANVSTSEIAKDSPYYEN
jgi:hypothetical protein